MKTSVENIKNNWVLLSFLCGIILWYGSVNARLTAVEAQQVQQATVEDKVNTLVTAVEVIKAQTKESDKKIDSLSDKVDYIIDNMKR